MNQQELDQIIENHKLWLESNGNQGKQANLDGETLNYLNLQNADLKSCTFEKSNLQHANLNSSRTWKTSFQNTNLNSAILENTRNLRTCIFDNAIINHTTID